MKTKICKIMTAVICMCFLFCLSGCSDKRYDEQWAVKNNGQKIGLYYGIDGADINISHCWDAIANLTDIPTIGIIDEGVDFASNYLAGSKSENNVDATKSEHGTNVASIITTNHDYGAIKGCLNNAKLVQATYDNSSADGIRKAVDGIKFFDTLGVRVVNCSFTLDSYDDLLYEAMADSDMLFVCAAGNTRGDLPAYPSLFELDNVICVGGINNGGMVSSYSHLSDYIDILAPGENVLTVGLNEKLSYMNGTSAAVPFVTAACALIACCDTNATASEIKQTVKETANKDILAKYQIKNAGLVDFGAIADLYHL